jgi:uncharacterized protein YndB with AHSA1/START domain
MKKSKTLPVGRGKIGYTTSHIIKQPVKKVWEAVTEAKHIKKYFVDKQSGEWGPDLKPVGWGWKEYGDETMEVYPTLYKKYERIEFNSPAYGLDYMTHLTFEFVKKGPRETIFRVHDYGYKQKDLKAAFMMCEGWTEFHTYLKAYLKWGVDVMRKA